MLQLTACVVCVKAQKCMIVMVMYFTRMILIHFVVTTLGLPASKLIWLSVDMMPKHASKGGLARLNLSMKCTVKLINFLMRCT